MIESVKSEPQIRTAGLHQTSPGPLRRGDLATTIRVQHNSLLMRRLNLDLHDTIAAGSFGVVLKYRIAEYDWPAVIGASLRPVAATTVRMPSVIGTTT